MKWGRRHGPYLLLILVGIAVPWSIVKGYRHVASSTYLDVSTLEIRGLERTDRSRLERHMHLLRGSSMLNLPRERARKQLSSSPWIEEIRLERDWPDRLVLHVDEHTPTAILAGEQLAFVDEGGEMIKTIEGVPPKEAVRSLPMISGLDRAELRTEHGRRLFERALRIVETYRRMKWTQRPLSNVHVDPVLGVTLITERPATEIRLGRRRLHSKLKRLKFLRPSLKERGIEPAYILLDQSTPLHRAVVGPRRGSPPESAENDG